MAKESFLDSLSTKLARKVPARLVPKKSAGVAVIFRSSSRQEEVLLIRRAEREGDPWSGQVAFPGGMVSASDKSFEETARRETAEEVGVDLSANASFLGYMRELKARMRMVVVVPSVFEMTADSEGGPEQGGVVLQVGLFERSGKERIPFDLPAPEKGRGVRVPLSRARRPRNLGADRENTLGHHRRPEVER